MKYTRVKAVTCALTASVIIFGSAAHTNASGVSYDLPAAGVGLVLDEGSSLSSVQEEAVQEERTAETVQEAEEAPAVTSEDIESGMTGVGESAIDTEVVSHVQEQQVEAAIANGVGVASVLNAAAPETAPAASETEVALTAGVESAVNVLPSAAAGIVEPVSLSALQNEADNTSSEQPKEQTSVGSDPEPVSEQPSETTSEQDTTEKQTESSQETSSESESESSTEETSSESEAESSTEETSSESESESSTEETSYESEAESSTEETSSESEAESSAEETPSESGSESSTEETSSESESESSTEQTPSESTDPAETESASQQPSESTTETAGTGETATGSESTAVESSAEQPSSESAAAAETESVQAASAAASHTTTSSAGSSVAEFALQFVGNPYEYGGTSLTNGADCSGFVMSVYENFGVSLPHSSSADRNVGTEVEGGLSNAQPGDIVCYSGHVGIYIGNGQIVHASTEETGIKVSDADYRTPITVRRIFN